MKTDEALRLALEAFQSGVKTQFGRLDWIEFDIELVEQAITAIKAALEAKDEPQYVAFMDTPQRTWVGLTDEDLANCSGHEVRWALHWEKVLKEKNT
jgi:hypothetical protein